MPLSATGAQLGCGANLSPERNWITSPAPILGVKCVALNQHPLLSSRYCVHSLKNIYWAIAKLCGMRAHSAPQSWNKDYFNLKTSGTQLIWKEAFSELPCVTKSRKLRLENCHKCPLQGGSAPMKRPGVNYSKPLSRGVLGSCRWQKVYSYLSKETCLPIFLCPLCSPRETYSFHRILFFLFPFT